MDAEIDAIYTYWFGDLLTNPDAESRNELWFMGGQTVDNEIRERFGPLVSQLLRRALGHGDEPEVTPSYQEQPLAAE